MFKDLLARFKRVFTVAEWKREAQSAIAQKEFVVASLTELHRVERLEATDLMNRQMQLQQGVGRQPTRPAPSGNYNYFSNREDSGRKSEYSLAELMNQIKMQQ
jgi:hypothetical protein